MSKTFSCWLVRLNLSSAGSWSWFARFFSCSFQCFRFCPIQYFFNIFVFIFIFFATLLYFQGCSVCPHRRPSLLRCLGVTWDFLLLSIRPITESRIAAEQTDHLIPFFCFLFFLSCCSCSCSCICWYQLLFFKIHRWVSAGPGGWWEHGLHTAVAV